MENARLDHKEVVKERIEHIGKMADVVPMTESLFQVSKEIAQMEKEVFELKQKVQFKQEVKSVLDNWLRQEASIREQEQKTLAFTVIEKVKAKLADPKIQQSILAGNISELEKLSRK